MRYACSVGAPSHRHVSYALAAVCLVAAGLPTSLAADPPAAVRGTEFSGGRLITGATPQRIIHFTFDDGPDPRTTPALLDALDEAGVKATFFFSASRFSSRLRRNAGVRELAREVLERGHTVGSHSVEHVRMSRLGPAALRAQIAESDRLFREVLGAPVRLFRPPFGARNSALDRILARAGYTTVLWNIGLADWVERPAPELLETFRKVLARNQRDGQRGGVVLLHDTHSWSVEAFRLIMRDLERRNCELLSRDEELYDVVDTLAPFFVPAEGAPPGAQAPPAVLSAASMAARQQELRRRLESRCQSHP